MACFFYTLRATVVKEKTIFWSDVRSDLVDVTRNDDEENFLNSQLYEGCGETKSCFGVPENCVKSKNCEYLGTFSVQSGKYNFEVKSPSKNFFQELKST